MYPVKRKRCVCASVQAHHSGPIAGFAKMTEARVKACEDALWFLLQDPVVQERLRDSLSVGLAADGADGIV